MAIGMQLFDMTQRMDSLTETFFTRMVNKQKSGLKVILSRKCSRLGNETF